MREIAKGRVWSGVDALDLKLIDRFGGLDDALKETIKLAGLENAKRVNVRIYPQISAWDVFWSSLGGAATTAERLEALSAALDSQTAKTLLRLIGDGERVSDQEVRMPSEEMR